MFSSKEPVTVECNLSSVVVNTSKDDFHRVCFLCASKNKPSSVIVCYLAAKNCLYLVCPLVWKPLRCQNTEHKYMSLLRKEKKKHILELFFIHYYVVLAAFV